MLTKNTAAVVAAICATALSITSVRAEEKEEKVEFKSLPEKVQKTIEKHADGGKIVRVERETEDGKVAYEAVIDVKGHKREVVVEKDGDLEAIEEVIELSAAPKAAKEEIEKESAGGKVLKVERITKGSEVTFEALIDAKGKRQEIVVSNAGKVVKRENKSKKDND